MELSTIGVAGSGLAAAGIAQLCVQHGLEVVLFDETEEALGDAEDRVLRGLQRAEQPGAFSLLRKSTDLDRLAGCDLVVESGNDDPERKRDMLRRIDARLDPSRILAVQTTALPVGVVATAIENPDRVLGLHFFPPAPITPLVEIIRAVHSSEAAVRTGLDFAALLKKTPVRCKDVPGFIVSRVGRPFFLSAVRMLERGRGTPATIDAALRESGGFRLGPFEWMDALGLDEDFAVSALVYEMLDRPPQLKPSSLAEKMIARGCRGRRNGRGYYVYGENPPGTVNTLVGDLVPGLGGRKTRPPEVLETVLGAVFAEAHAVADEGTASAEDIDKAMRLGMAWPRGPFEWEKEVGR